MKSIFTTLVLLMTFYANAQNITLIELPYANNALEPVISEKTIELHHGKHLQGYVNNLNKQIAGTPFENMDLVEIVQKSNGSIFNNAGQVLNHNLYFTQFSPNGSNQPKGKLADAINQKWGSFDNFKKEFNSESTSLFGSGWTWLSSDKNGNLIITKEMNAGNPVTNGLNPILGFDVWEHAYYIDYQNKRADHLNALWNIIDWDTVSNRYQ